MLLHIVDKVIHQPRFHNSLNISELKNSYHWTFNASLSSNSWENEVYRMTWLWPHFQTSFCIKTPWIASLSPNTNVVLKLATLANWFFLFSIHPYRRFVTTDVLTCFHIHEKFLNRGVGYGYLYNVQKQIYLPDAHAKCFIIMNVWFNLSACYRKGFFPRILGIFIVLQLERMSFSP